MEAETCRGCGTNADVIYHWDDGWYCPECHEEKVKKCKEREAHGESKSLSSAKSSSGSPVIKNDYDVAF